MSEDASRKDAFIEMVTAKASVDLRLSDYHPRSMLVVPEHDVRRPKFPASTTIAISMRKIRAGYCESWMNALLSRMAFGCLGESSSLIRPS